jgi:hypothetical protein
MCLFQLRSIQDKSMSQACQWVAFKDSIWDWPVLHSCLPLWEPTAIGYPICKFALARPFRKVNAGRCSTQVLHLLLCLLIKDAAQTQISLSFSRIELCSL